MFNCAVSGHLIIVNMETIAIIDQISHKEELMVEDATYILPHCDLIVNPNADEYDNSNRTVLGEIEDVLSFVNSDNQLFDFWERTGQDQLKSYLCSTD